MVEIKKVAVVTLDTFDSIILAPCVLIISYSVLYVDRTREEEIATNTRTKTYLINHKCKAHHNRHIVRMERVFYVGVLFQI